MNHPIPRAALLLLACSVLPVPAQERPAAPVTDAMLQAPDPADWLMWRRTLDNWGHSPLDQIDADNVGELELVWSRPLHTGIQEGTPLVYDGVMYFPNPSDIVQAMDAATGELFWEYVRALPPDIGDYFPAVGINRNMAIYENKIIDTSTDDYIFALDVATGELVWEHLLMDYRAGGLQTSGPIIADGKIISGRGCEPEGGPDACVIMAHDGSSGEELWRTRTIPAPGEPGGDTWGDVPYGERWHVGTWMVPSYDPVLGRIFIGTAVTSPAPKFMLGGNDHQYLYHNSTLALDAITGDIVWYYQHLVDHWDLDHPFERLLVDTAVAPDPGAVSWINPNLPSGEVRKVVTGVPGKTGIVYTLDRETGEFLWATPTVAQNVIVNIDGATGAVQAAEDVLFTGAEQTRFVCPTPSGGKNWPAGAYSPATNTMYMPLQNTCMNIRSTAEEPDPNDLYSIDVTEEIAPGEENVGTIRAISAETGVTSWIYEQPAGVVSLIVTDGGLVFGGDAAGWFRALDQMTGEVLWETDLGSQVTGYPVTYAVDGKQYVAVSTGSAVGLIALNRLVSEDFRAGTDTNLYVFALPD